MVCRIGNRCQVLIDFTRSISTAYVPVLHCWLPGGGLRNSPLPEPIFQNRAIPGVDKELTIGIPPQVGSHCRAAAAGGFRCFAAAG